MKALDAALVMDAVKYLDSWLEFNFNDSRLPGMQVAISYGGKLVYSSAFGHANLESNEKLTKQHTFRVASHSKTFTATALMQLVESKRIALDDPVSQHLEWFISSSDSRMGKVTIRQLLNHTAGMIRDGEDADYWQLLRPYPNKEELQAYISKAKLIYPSDKRFKYSNYGYSYLGLLIEEVTGQSYGAYAHEHIISRLGLQSIGAELDEKAKNTLATGYGLELLNHPPKPFGHLSTNGMAAATGFYSNAEDLCSYFSAHFYGNDTLVTDASKRAMQKAEWESEKKTEKYGLGMAAYKKSGWKLRGHGGGFPGFITSTKFDPEKKLVVSVLINSLSGPSEMITGAIINIIDSFHAKASSGSKADKTHEKFTGRFYSKWGATDIVLAGSTLRAIRPRRWSDFQYSDRLKVVSANTLVIEDASGYESPGEQVVYAFDDDRVKSLQYAGISLVSWKEARKAGWF